MFSFDNVFSQPIRFPLAEDKERETICTISKTLLSGGESSKLLFQVGETFLGRLMMFSDEEQDAIVNPKV